MATKTSNPMKAFRDVSHTLDLCASDKTKCACTDPSYNYTTPCKIDSDITSIANRTRCTYGTPVTTAGLTSSVGSLAGYNSGARNDMKFTVKPGNNATAQSFTNTGANNFNVIAGGANTYPASKLFCKDPTTGSYPTQSIPKLSYSNGTFSDWNSSTKAASGTFDGNFGFSTQLSTGTGVAAQAPVALAQ